MLDVLFYCKELQQNLYTIISDLCQLLEKSVLSRG